MPSLNEREVTSAPGCHNCKHCTGLIYHHRADIAEPTRYFCFVDDIPEKEAERAICSFSKVKLWEVPDMYTPDFVEIMKLDPDKPDYRKTPRSVEGFNCCQFWEQEEEKSKKEWTPEEMKKALADYLKKKKEEEQDE